MRGLPYDKEHPENFLGDAAILGALAVGFGRDAYKYVTLRDNVVIEIRF